MRFFFCFWRLWRRLRITLRLLLLSANVALILRVRLVLSWQFAFFENSPLNNSPFALLFPGIKLQLNLHPHNQRTRQFNTPTRKKKLPHRRKNAFHPRDAWFSNRKYANTSTDLKDDLNRTTHTIRLKPIAIKNAHATRFTGPNAYNRGKFLPPYFQRNTGFQWPLPLITFSSRCAAFLHSVLCASEELEWFRKESGTCWLGSLITSEESLHKWWIRFALLLLFVFCNKKKI